MTNDLEVPWHVVQHLGHVLAEPGHAFAAVGAGAGAVVGRLVDDVLAGQMIGQRIALGFGTFTGRGRTIRSFGAGGVFGCAGFQFLEPELELLDLATDPLRRSAKRRSASRLNPPQLGDLELQLLDLQCLQLHCRLRRLQLALTGQREGAQFSGIDRQFSRGKRHVSNYPGPYGPTRIKNESVICHTNTGCGNGGGAGVRRQSIASISTENCAGESVIGPSIIGGQTKRPFSRRLAINHIPLPSQYRPLK